MRHWQIITLHADKGFRTFANLTTCCSVYCIVETLIQKTKLVSNDTAVKKVVKMMTAMISTSSVSLGDQVKQTMDSDYSVCFHHNFWGEIFVICGELCCVPSSDGLKYFCFNNWTASFHFFHVIFFPFHKFNNFCFVLSMSCLWCLPSFKQMCSVKRSIVIICKFKNTSESFLWELNWMTLVHKLHHEDVSLGDFMYPVFTSTKLIKVLR